MTNNKIITIDGPAGSGKSTIAKMLAKELGLNYIDTGAMYRAATLIALENNINPEDERKILKVLKKTKIEMEGNPSDENQYTIVKINNRDVTDKIRSKDVGNSVSIVSKLSGIRKYLVSLQRKMAKDGKAVLEGRDTGSVVFPDALLKVYLTASVEERVRRRKVQNQEKGIQMSEEAIREEIINRDKIDSTRKDSPLVIPKNAVIIDSTNLSIKQTFEKIKELYYEKIRS